MRSSLCSTPSLVSTGDAALGEDRANVLSVLTRRLRRSMPRAPERRIIVLTSVVIYYGSHAVRQSVVMRPEHRTPHRHLVVS